MEDVSTVMEPTPFAEMFGESEDLFDVRCSPTHKLAHTKTWSVQPVGLQILNFTLSMPGTALVASLELLLIAECCRLTCS